MTDFYPAAGADDTSEVYSTGTQSLTTSPMSIRANASDYRLAGLRVQLTGVNQGDTILTAALNGYFSPASRDDIRCNIYGELVAAPGAFTTTAYHLSGRMDANPTTASVEWQFTGTGVGWYTSPSLVSVIQELVNQGSWSDNGYIVLFLDPRAYSSGEFGFMAAYEDASNDWYLSLTWSAGNTPPTIVPNTSTGISVTTTTPTIEFTGTDPDSDDLRYQVQITNNPDTFDAGPIYTTDFLGGYT